MVDWFALWDGYAWPGIVIVLTLLQDDWARL